MVKSYRTIARAEETEIIINRSRFIGRAYPIKDEEEVNLYLDRAREEFPDASHHCYAYVLGRSSNIQRFNDDGEPGGTAGMPILQVILQQDIEDTLVIVIRYFGGVKLGAGGLVRAYSKSAAETLSKAGKKTMTKSFKGSINLDYASWGPLEYFLNQQGIPILKTEYMDDVKVEVMTKMDWDNFSNMIKDQTSARAKTCYIGEVFHSWD